MATNLRLGPDTERALRERATITGRSQQALIRDAVDRYLGLDKALPERPPSLGELRARRRMKLPFSFTEPIHTERLTLRLMTAADVDDVQAFQGREDVCRYLLHEPRTRPETEQHVAKGAAATTLAADGDWIEPVIDLGGRVIGHMYFALSSVENLGGEIGWTLHPDYFGRGYATEASRAMLDLAFGELGLHRMHAELDPRNDASIALCRRLGMREEAHLVKNMLVKGSWGDTGVYAVLAEEWAAEPGVRVIAQGLDR